VKAKCNRWISSLLMQSLLRGPVNTINHCEEGNQQTFRIEEFAALGQEKRAQAA
jgi:hypothetical protein